MSTRAVNTAEERIDLLLRQAEQFYALDLVGEAIARFQSALSECEKEAEGLHDQHTEREIRARRSYAIQMLERLGAKPSLHI